MLKKKNYRLLLHLIAIYLINRISYFAHELLKQFIYYDYNHHYFELKTKHIDHLSDLGSAITYLIPFSPYFIFGWFPIILLNVILVFSNYIKPFDKGNFMVNLKNHLFVVLLLYLIASLVFVVLSAINNYQKTVPCDHCMFEILLENYTPYAPQLLCGFLFGNILIAFMYYLMKLIVKKGRSF